MDIFMGTAMANGIISVILVPQMRQLMREIDDVTRLDENRQLLKPQLSTMKDLLLDVIKHRQTTAAPETVKNNLQRISEEIKKARELAHCLQRPQPFIDCLLCKPQLSTQIDNWKTSFDELFKHVKTGFSSFLQEEPYSELAGSELVGSGIKLADTQLKRWLEAPRLRIIGVYGDEGTGKTTLLKQIYNNYQIFWLERSTAKIGYMLSARELHIVWGQGQRYWRWGSRPDSRFQEVPELIGVHWLEIKGGMDCRLLSADTEYRVLFMLKFTDDSRGWHDPIKFSLTTPEGQEIESKELVVGREVIGKHEWMEGVAGEFKTSAAEDIYDEDSYIEFCMTEVVAEWKGGLVIDGVRIEPKST